MIFPDMYDNNEYSYILCSRCFRKTHYALNTSRYICDVHGPVIVSEIIPVGVRP